MKKKLNDMSPDMFNDAMSSTPIPVFTRVNDAVKNDTSERFTKVPEVQKEQFTKVPEVSLDGNQIKNELIRINLETQTVSARALYAFLELAERFSKWWKRMVSYGLIENVDFTYVPNGTPPKIVDTLPVPNGTPPKIVDTLPVPNGTPPKIVDTLPVPNGTPPKIVDTLPVPNGTPNSTNEIADYLLTIDAAKHIAMVQRNEKGFQARQYFINIEKLYYQQMFSKNQKSEKKETPLLENLKMIVAQLEKEQENYQALQQQHQLLIEKKAVLERFCEQKSEQAEHFSKTIDVAAKVNDFRTPHIYKMWYSELPTMFSSIDAEQLGLKYNISRATIFRMLRNQQSNLFLFRKLRYGKYEKYYTVFE
jgi:phage anti-repressor protein